MRQNLGSAPAHRIRHALGYRSVETTQPCDMGAAKHPLRCAERSRDRGRLFRKRPDSVEPTQSLPRGREQVKSADPGRFLSPKRRGCRSPRGTLRLESTGDSRARLDLSVDFVRQIQAARLRKAANTGFALLVLQPSGPLSKRV